MAAQYNEDEEKMYSGLTLKDRFSSSIPKESSSFSNSASKHKFSGSFTRGGSNLDLQQYGFQNDNRATAFDAICKELGTLHNEPLSPRDWEDFKNWYDHCDDDSMASSMVDSVYKKCRMTMIDVFGQLPTEDEWKIAKEWFMARYEDVSKKVHDKGEDKLYAGGIPKSTEQQREHRLPEKMHGFDSKNDPKSKTRKEVEDLRQYTESEVDLLKKEVDNLKTEMVQLKRENLELSRRGALPPTWTINEGFRKPMEDESGSYDSNRELKLEELQMKCDQLTRQNEYMDEELGKLKSLNGKLFERQGASPTTWRINEEVKKQMDDDSGSYDRGSMEVKIEELQLQCDQLTHENEYKDDELGKLKSLNGKLSERVNVLEAECGKVRLDLQKHSSHIHLLQERLKERQDELNTYVQNARYELKSKDQQIQLLEEEKDDALRRLSTLASAKLSDNNPDITDLSDMNRPQKIADKYSELYDNEWTDAYEYLTASGHDHQKAIVILLRVLESCFQYCKTVGRRQYEHILVTACSPSLDEKDQDFGAVGKMQSLPTCKETITQKVIELRKAAFQHSLGVIKQAYQTSNRSDVVQLTCQEILIYTDKCLEVSWLACIQDPPLEIVSDFPPYSKVDLNIVRKYTKSGEYVEYVIWPALLLSNDGALLSKGVVQCTSSAQGARAQPPHQPQIRNPNNTNQDDYYV